MNSEREWRSEVHRHLDGDTVPGLDPSARQEAARFEDALRAYAADLRVPGAEVDRAVMAVVRDRSARARARSVWRWLIEPHPVHLRPALVAATLALLVGLGYWALERVPEGAPPGPPVVGELGAVLVRFELRAPDARAVSLAGSFNHWDEDALPLSRSAATGLWTVTVPLPPGRHEYLFVVDHERWIPDPSAHAQVDDGFGQLNSLITVGPRGVVRT